MVKKNAAFRAKLSGELREMVYAPSLTDPDVYRNGRVEFMERLAVALPTSVEVTEMPLSSTTKIKMRMLRSETTQEYIDSNDGPVK